MIVNCVMMKVRSDRMNDIPIAIERLLSMKGKIVTLKDIRVHKDIAHGSRSYDLMQMTEFANMSDLNEYIKDPYHTEVGKYIMEIMEDILSVCYEE